jgi:hypothetical protein
MSAARSNQLGVEVCVTPRATHESRSLVIG